MRTRHVEFAVDPLRIPSIALSIAHTRQMVEALALQYVNHAKEDESTTEFVRRVSDDAFPPRLDKFQPGARANFRADLRKEIGRLERRGAGMWK